MRPQSLMWEMCTSRSAFWIGAAASAFYLMRNVSNHNLSLAMFSCGSVLVLGLFFDLVIEKIDTMSLFTVLDWLALLISVAAVGYFIATQSWYTGNNAQGVAEAIFALLNACFVVGNLDRLFTSAGSHVIYG